MIKNLIFDFGDIFINLDKPATFRELEKLGYMEVQPDMLALAKQYEMGLVSSEGFLLQLNTMLPLTNVEHIQHAWNAIIRDFPEYRLTFVEELKQENNYRLFLLSNTNDLHIEYVKKTMGLDRFERFETCFEQFYLSHEIHMRKPNSDIFEFVLDQNQLKAEETFFIDDTKENTDTAQLLGIKSWNLQVGNEDIIDLKSKL
ncbi:HAD-IA family hydrolase [Maribacter sp. CXY002]|uniref:HAD-IA family hydrolase n=1 Tax=Maribacter luteocoastalis TaxID=3407671 RepID=UPI003B67A917